MQVLKFGGSSVANAENIKRISTIIRRAATREEKTIVVVSALGGITDMILEAGNLASVADESYCEIFQEITNRHLETVKALLPINNQSGLLSKVMQRCNEMEDTLTGILLLSEFSGRVRDRLLGYGEIFSSQIISSFLEAEGISNTWCDSREIIKTDSTFTNALVDFSLTNKLCKDYFNNSSSNLFIAPGFIASDKAGNATTLGRGGSDYTAAIFAASTDARELQIWTDVSGMMTADPRLVANAKAITSISYQEAMELSHFGAKVIYAPTIQPVMLKKIPVWIKNTFLPDDAGTGIFETPGSSSQTIKGISSINKIRPAKP